MAPRIEVPEDLIHDLEQEASHRHVSLADIVREALHMWQSNRHAPVNDREHVMQILKNKGLLSRIPTEIPTSAQPLSIEEAARLAAKVAKGGPLSELIIQERRGDAG